MRKYVNIKSIMVNVDHIENRLSNRSTSCRDEYVKYQVRQVLELLVSKRAFLTKDTEWEVITSSFKAVGNGLRWRTVLDKNQYSKSVVHSWTV